MSKVIPFPSLQQRQELRYQKIVEKRKDGVRKIKSKIVTFAQNCCSKLWYGSRVIIASLLHGFTVIILSVLYQLRLVTIVFLALACVLNYFHLGSLVTKDNLLVPLMSVMALLACCGQEMIDGINTNKPFHSLLRCKPREEKQPEKHTEYIILDRM